jgi:hypothetical protein
MAMTKVQALWRRMNPKLTTATDHFTAVRANADGGDFSLATLVVESVVTTPTVLQTGLVLHTARSQ